jgi:hypothetical protein
MPALVPLANTTLGSNTATVTFSSISQAYQDLYLVVVGKASSGFSQGIRFNGDTGSNYNVLRFTGDGATVVSGVAANQTRGLFSAFTFNSSINSAAFIHILDYTRTDKHKTTLSDAHSNPDTEIGLICNRWANTAAITTVALVNDSGTYQTGTTFALYGVKGS